jgi:hypothetical protein
MGPSGQLKKFTLAGNVPIEKSVERIVNDDLKAAEASFALYKREQDVYKITTILSSGVLGIKRKLVPTRWSITATDDIITKQLLGKIRDYPSINEYLVYSSRYLDNNFNILLMPGSWEYEGFEAWSPGSFWSKQLKEAEIVGESEGFRGRTAYADKEGGGYYAARIGVVEHLHALRRQARAMVFREIYEGYVVPLGVWVVRETVRNAFNSAPKRFATLAEALKFIDSQQRIPTSSYLRQSVMLRQRRLHDFGKA